MMFLQYAIWGAWYVTMGTYLEQTLRFDGPQVGLAYGALAIAAMISPIFVGMVADRFFATQKVLGTLHLAGGALMWLAASVQEFSLFYPALLAYTLCYSPTIALANSLSFRNLDNPDREFPGIRVLGTIAWIVITNIIGFMNVEAQALPMQMAAGLSIVMGLYSFSLPHTPPVKSEGKPSVAQTLGLEAISMLKDRSFAILVLASLLICIPLSFYYGFTNLFLNNIGVSNAANKMSLGQMSELFFLLIMPWFFVRLGVKRMIMLAMLCWAIRYLFFAYGDAGSGVWMLYIGIVLHGICFDFFFVTGQMYADNKAPAHLKSAAQGLMTFATYGVGMFIGTWLSGEVVGIYTSTSDAGNPVYDWTAIWWIPAIGSAMVLLAFALLFKERKSITA
jgi:nucleoside transporter